MSAVALFQRRLFWTSCIAFLRWTTAPSFRALAGVLLVPVRDGDADARLD